MSDLMSSVFAIREHASRYQLAADYYHGEVSEVFVSDVVKRALRGAECEFDINLARRPVDAVLDRTRILAISVPGSEDLTRRLVDEVWVPNRMDRKAKTTHWGALTYGDAYLMVWDGEEEGTVELHFNSPTSTRVFYDAENPQVKTHAAKMWAEGHGDDQVFRLNLYYPDRIERWVTVKGGKGDEPSEWQPFTGDDQDAILDNPHGEVPVFHFRTAEPYGRPVHRGAFGPQNAVTKLSATMMGTVDFQGFPQRYALTKAGDTLSAAQVFDDDEDPDTTERGQTAGPGRILDLTADQVGQFAPADMNAFLDPASFYIRAMASATATPLRFFDPQGQIPSGEALRADEAPLAVRITDFEELAGETWQEVLVFAAKVAGFAIPTPDVTWAPVQTVSDLAGWQTVAAKQAAGVPARQALTEAGYTSELVDGWLEGSQAPNLDTRIGYLDRIGGAMQKLGAAVQMGAIDQATVERIVDGLMADLDQEGDAA